MMVGSPCSNPADAASTRPEPSPATRRGAAVVSARTNGRAPGTSNTASAGGWGSIAGSPRRSSLSSGYRICGAGLGPRMWPDPPGRRVAGPSPATAPVAAAGDSARTGDPTATGSGPRSSIGPAAPGPTSAGFPLAAVDRSLARDWPRLAFRPERPGGPRRGGPASPGATGPGLRPTSRRRSPRPEGLVPGMNRPRH